MEEFLKSATDFWKDWKDLILAVAGSSGWIMFFAKKYYEKRAKKREIAIRALEELLRPMEIRLEGNKRLHGMLTKDTELSGKLEWAPDYVQNYFKKKEPEVNIRKFHWRKIVDDLFDGNDKVIELIEGKGFHIYYKEFRTECIDFIDHAKQWKIAWNSAFDLEHDAPKGRNLLAPVFPPELDRLLKEEIEYRVRQRD